MFDRLKLLIGEDNLLLINKTKVLVVGVGGVGGECVVSLVRSGIENITIIDFDKVDIFYTTSNKRNNTFSSYSSNTYY